MTFRPPGPGNHRADLVVVGRNENGRATGRLGLRGRAGSYPCDRSGKPLVLAQLQSSEQWRRTESVRPRPLSRVQLKAADGYEVTGWSVMTQPANSNAELRPDRDVAQPTIFVDLVGTYRVEMSAKNAEDCEVRDTIRLLARPRQDIHVELVWRTPSDDNPEDRRSTDLDLHYLHPPDKPWNKAPWDVYWQNKTSDWGTKRDRSDNPSLDRDDSYGQGPETLRHDHPEEGEYAIGVHYYKTQGLGTVRATVRVYLDGQLAAKYEDKILQKRFLFWEVAHVDWPAQRMFKRDRVTEGFPQPSSPAEPSIDIRPLGRRRGDGRRRDRSV